MNIDIKQIFSTSWGFVITNRYLWFLGALGPGLYGLGGFNGQFSTSFDSTSFSNQDEQKVFEGFISSFREMTSSIPQYFPYSIDEIILFFLAVVLVIYFVFLLINSRFFNANVVAVNNLDQGNKSGFKEAYRQSKQGTISIIGARLILTLFNLLMLLPVIIIGWSAIVQSDIKILIWLAYFIPYFLVFFVLGFFVKAIIQLSMVAISLERLRTFEALRRAAVILRTEFMTTASMWFWSFLAGIGFNIVLGFTVLILVIMIALIMGLMYLIIGQIFTTAFFVALAIGVIVLLAILIIAIGFINSFFNSIWTLFYKQIRLASEQ